MLNQVAVVMPAVNECVLECVLNSSVENCGCFKIVITFVISCFVHCIANYVINCRLKGEGSMFDGG
jgi:hypothetical protein